MTMLQSIKPAVPVWLGSCVSVSCTRIFSVILQVPENYRLERGAVQLHGNVTSGFGRGSRQLGFATANLPPKPLATELEGLPKGVYFG